MSREDWLRRLREQLPFASNRVSSPADAEVNVPAIHRAAYERLLAAADEARMRPRGGLGVVLWGDPGVGKSHLLARFAAETVRENRGVFLLVHNLLAAPRLVPATVVRTFVTRLTERQPQTPRTSQPEPRHQQAWNDRPAGNHQAGDHQAGDQAGPVLYELLYRQVRLAVPRPQGRPPSSIGKEQARQLFMQRLAETVVSTLPDQNRPDGDRIAAVLFAYFLAVHRLKDRAASAEWHAHYARVATIAEQFLRGDELDAEAWQLLELDPAWTATAATREPGAVDDQFLETVCLMLLELARQAEQLVVICFDQVENLSDERFVELFRFNHALLDHGRNLLVITAGVRSDLVALRTRGLAPEAAWDRLAGDTIDLYFVSLAAARELLETRLRMAFIGVSHPAEVAEAIGRDSLFPLGGAWWAARVAGLIEARPRDVISWAHARWRDRCRALATDWEAALRDTQESGGAAATAASPTGLVSGDPPDPPDPPAIPSESQASGVHADAWGAKGAGWGGFGESESEDFEQRVDIWVERRVAMKRDELRSDPSRLAPDSGQLSGLLRATLVRICGQHAFGTALSTTSGPPRGDAPKLEFSLEERKPTPGKLPTYDFVLQCRVEGRVGAGDEPALERGWQTGVIVLVTVNAKSTAATYRRLAGDSNPPDRVVVVFDERIPESLGVAGTRNREEAERRFADNLQFFDLSFHEYSDLAAMEAVLADARSGDLEIEHATGGLVRLSERDVETSYSRRQRYMSSPLIQLLLAPPA